MISIQLIVCIALSAVVCDVAFATPYIIGGSDATPGEIPWMVSLGDEDGHMCGGSILDARNILTAAHCVIDEEPGDVYARIGSIYHASGGATYAAANFVIHPDYTLHVEINDIAIVQLSEDMVLDGVNSKAVTLADSELAPGDQCVVAGWGYTSNDPPKQMSDILQVAKVPIVSRSDCQAVYGNDIVIDSGLVCAGGGVAGHCEYDSGGPLTKDGAQYGVVTWGDDPCAYVGDAGVYANTVFYRQWIIDNMA